MVLKYKTVTKLVCQWLFWYISFKCTVTLTKWSFIERLLDSSDRRKLNTLSMSNQSWLMRLWLNPVENSSANTHCYLLCDSNWGWWRLSTGLARYSASRSTSTRTHVHPRMCRAGCLGDKTRERSTISWQQLPPWGLWNADSKDHQALHTSTCRWSH